MDDRTKYSIAFASTGIIGPARITKINHYFGDLGVAWEATRKDYMAAGLDEKTANELVERKMKVNIEKVLESMIREKINVILSDNPDFPSMLHEVYPVPTILFYKGKMKCEEFSLAVVGSRKATDYAKCTIPIFVSALVAAGGSIVSGLALGVDTIAHQATLQFGGRTIGILAGGIDRGTVYPPENKELIDKIVANNGCVISEYAPYILPIKQNFPARNRLISGMSKGVLVIEAKDSSGALITAKCGLEQGKEIFTVPGSIFSPNSQGTNSLIKQGAKLVTSPEDIFDEFNLKCNKNEIIIEPENGQERIVINVFSSEPSHVDEIALATNINISKLNSILMIMEIRGMIKNIGNGRYIKL